MMTQRFPVQTSTMTWYMVLSFHCQEMIVELTPELRASLAQRMSRNNFIAGLGVNSARNHNTFHFIYYYYYCCCYYYYFFNTFHFLIKFMSCCTFPYFLNFYFSPLSLTIHAFNFYNTKFLGAYPHQYLCVIF